ncbi:hypothetical protein SAMN05444396_10836 [Flavobacterium segetis]|uniref:Uncharacterized protein n=1 Tax=Flavobacterium segetis TaxID=271157 RepID=A0A1M5IT51_9FLAO|nr:hypothetical protein [Flavobacterium segetis]SHG31199.1 hypothetical protein SAMN05444396_10836 [Flavobacterium segetis]
MRICDTKKPAKSLLEFAFSCWLLTKNRSSFLLLHLLLLFGYSVPSFAQKSQLEEVLIALKVQNVGSIEISTLINQRQEVYLSVPEVFDFLKIKNEHNESYSVLAGFFINENNVFHIDETVHTISYKGKVIQIPPEDLIHINNNLYLKASYFNSVFELENTFSFRDLSISMSSSLELPSVREARLLKIRSTLNKSNYGFIADTTIRRDNPLFHFSNADWELNMTQRSNGINQEQLRLGLGGIIAGGEFASSFNYTNNQAILSRNQYYRWRYVDNNNQYLTQISAGKIANSLTTTIVSPIIGAHITNAKTTARKSFSTYLLSDYTKPEWTVELYINNILVDYTKADATGFFSFTVPLLYGKTDVSVRYYGLWGEEELSTKQLVIPFYFLSQNKLEYNLSSGIIEEDKKSLFANAKASYGLSDYITIEGGLEYVSSSKKNNFIPYFGSSIRLANQLFVSGGYYSKVKYTGNLNFSSIKNVHVDLDYTKYEKGQDAVRFNYSEVRKARLSVPVRTSLISGVSRFTVQENIYPTGKFTISELAFSGMIYKLNINLITSSYFTSTIKPFVFSTLSSSLRFPKGFVLTPNIRYEYHAAEITSLSAQLRKKLFKKGFLQASFDWDFKYNSSSLQIGFQYNFKFSNAGFSSNINKNGSSFSQLAKGSLIFEPHADFVEFNGNNNISKASVKFEPFLDLNGDGKRDINEQSVRGVEVTLNGGTKILNAKEGITIITGLEPYVKNFVTLSTAKVNNIAWRLKDKTLNIILNANQLRTIEIPISVMGEVAGMVQYSKNGEITGASGLKINIYRDGGDFVTSVLSEADGFFGYLGLISGQYSARIDSIQLQKLQLRVESVNTDFVIDNGSEGAIVDNVEFILYQEETNDSTIYKETEVQ